MQDGAVPGRSHVRNLCQFDSPNVYQIGPRNHTLTIHLTINLTINLIIKSTVRRRNNVDFVPTTLSTRCGIRTVVIWRGLARESSRVFFFTL